MKSNADVVISDADVRVPDVDEMVSGISVMESDADVVESISGGQNVNVPDDTLLNLRVAVCQSNISSIHEMVLAKPHIVNSSFSEGSGTILHENIRSAPLHVKLEMVELFAGFDANPNISDIMGNTPLHIACEKGYPKVLLQLLVGKCGANVNVKNLEGKTPLHLLSASDSRDKDDLKFLIEMGGNVHEIDNMGRTPLYNAESNMVKHLIAMGASIDHRDNMGLTPLHFAVIQNDFHRAETYVKCYAADINAQCTKGKTPLHYSTELPNESLTVLLLKCGAQANRRDMDGKMFIHYFCMKEICWIGDLHYFFRVMIRDAVNVVDCAGRSPLHYVRNSYLVYPLLELGVNIDSVDNDGLTPLHMAVLRRDMDVVRVLTLKGANVNSQCVCGKTPLHYVVELGDQKILYYLVCFSKVNLNIKDNEENTVLSLALKKKLEDVVTLLREKGALG